jgi:hypothetical protein
MESHARYPKGVLLMEPDRIQNINDRLNQWIAGQGFWFQLKHSMSGGTGLEGAGAYHLMRLGFRVLIFLGVLVLAVWWYLIQIPNTEGFSEKAELSIKKALKGENVVLDGLSRHQGRMNIKRLAVTGKKDAFFTDFDAKNVRCRMGLLDSLASSWRMDGMSMSDLEINIRAGAEDAVAAATVGDVLFTPIPGVVLDSLDSENTTVTWGFTAFSKGKIEGSQMKVRRRDDGWWIQFKGGKFSQNWLNELEIEELQVFCKKDGITVEKGLLLKGSGRVELSNITIRGAERPEVRGTARLRNLPLDGMLPESESGLVEGLLSGELRFSGSTNSSDGIGLSGRIELADGDSVVLRERIPLLQALRTVDSFNNYRRVVFRSGSFGLKSGGGRLQLDEIDLVSEDLMTLKGELVVRPPTKEEKEKSIEGANVGSSIPGEDSNNSASSDQALAWRELEGTEDVSFQSNMALMLAGSLRCEGNLEISLHPTAFDEAPILKAEYPADEATGRISLQVPISGTLDTVTLATAKEIQAKGKR